MSTHILIIGGGPGGYTAAIRGAQLGAKVTLVERDQVGGTCLNRGCIPTKTLYRSAEAAHILKEAASLGLEAGPLRVDGRALKDRCDTVVSQLRGGIEKLLADNSIRLIRGTGTFKDSRTVEVTLLDGSIETIRPDKIIIATGSKPSLLGIPGEDLPGVISSDQLLAMDKVPESMVVLGGGVISVEFATIYAALGTQVDILIRKPVVLRKMDSDIAKRFSSSLKRKGVNLHGNAAIQRIERTDNGLLRVVAAGKTGELTLESAYVLMALGRDPLLEGLGLDNTGMVFSEKGIPVDDTLQTSILGVYAIGDVIGDIMLAHWAAYQGTLAVEHALGIPHHDPHPGPQVVPDCTFTFPEIASAGLSEEDAREQYGDGIKTSKFLFAANGKALALGETEGFVKVVADPAGHLIGVHIMGPHASDLIHEGVLAIRQQLKATDFHTLIHAHPTLSEALHEAILGLNDEAIHVSPGKKVRQP